MRKSIQPDKIETIRINFPDLNISWLLTGEGEMLNDTDIIPIVHIDSSDPTLPLVPLIPLGAHAGTFTDFFAEGVELSRCERVVAPVPGCDLAIDVNGDSMQPDFPNGCRVYVRRINPGSFIAWGNVYVLDTENGAFIKKVYEGADDTLIARSINPEYPPFNIPRRCVFGMYRVLMMARGFSAT